MLNWFNDQFLYHIVFTCQLVLSVMPKKSWASEEQQTWLLAQLSDFRQAQEAKTTPAFFTELYQNYHEQWPPASPNAGEISKADGNEEKAITLKQKASEQVSDSFTIIYI
jgi:hypothetical protein